LGFDDFDWAASASPRVTTVAQPTYEIGKQAMQLLVRKMQGEKDELEVGGSHLIVLLSQLRIRDSTASPPRSPAAKGSLKVTPEPAVKHLNSVTQGQDL
jgi:DNA-binding LacI/PurR family transcriptional regulator